MINGSEFTHDSWLIDYPQITDERSALQMIRQGLAVRKPHDGNRWWVDRNQLVASVATPTESLWLNQAEAKIAAEAQ